MAGETLRAIQSSVDALLRRFEVAVARGQGSRERARDVYPASEIQSMITSLETAKGRLNAIYGGGGTTPVRINGDIDRALGELRLAAKMKDYRAQEVMYHIDNAAKYTLNVARALDSASIVRKTRSAKAAAVVAAAKAVGTKQDVPQLVQKTAQNISAGIKRLLPEIEAAGDQWVEDRSILRAIEMWGPIWAKAWASVMRDAKQSGDYIPNAATISQMLYQVETLRGSATQHFNRILKLLSQARV